MASSMGPAKMVTDGLVLHLDAGNTKSYPGSGTVWTDLSQTAITGSLTNGPTFSSNNGGEIVFDGTNDHIDIGNLSQYGFTNGIFSIESFVHITSSWTGGSQYPNLIGKGARGGWDTDGWSMFVFRDRPSVGQYSFGYGSRNGATTNIVEQSGVTSVNKYFHLTAVLNGSVISLYQDGILIKTGSQTINPPTTTDKLFIARDGDMQFQSVSYFTGRVGMVKLYNRALSANEVFQNYEATRERFNRPTIVTDDDARNFLNSANISSETQQRAVNDLVVDMKNVGLWGKMKAIYPFVGGTATTHKWNLKDPRDVNAAFRLTFSGGWTHSSTGAKPNGTNGYADTFITPTTHLTQNSTHLSYYSRTNSGGTTAEIGLYNSGVSPAALFQLGCNYANPSGSHINVDGITGNYNTTGYSINDGLGVSPNTNGTGYYVGTRISATYQSVHKNGIFGASSTGSAQGWSGCNVVLYLGARRQFGASGEWSNKECAFATIGDGLTNTDVTNLYTIVQKYQTTLGRQV